MKRDIENHDDLTVLVANFYDLLLNDETMAPIFIEVAQIDLATHLPHLVDFWYSLIFMTGTYRRNVMEMHLALNLKVKLEHNHFEIWLKYFENSVRDLYEGPNSELAIERANSIAQLMQHKIKQLRID